MDPEPEEGSGFVCIALPGDRLEELQLPMMVTNNTEHYKTAYTITVDYAHGESNPIASGFPVPYFFFPCLFRPLIVHGTGTTTGISAHDRALTARKLAEGAPASEFTRPGHLVPLRARDGGVLTRRGHTESAVGEFCLFGIPLFFFLWSSVICSGEMFD